MDHTFRNIPYRSGFKTLCEQLWYDGVRFGTGCKLRVVPAGKSSEGLRSFFASTTILTVKVAVEARGGNVREHHH